MIMLLFASLEAVTGIPGYIGFVLAFVLGACIGSFLNVVIYRVPNEKSLLPPSACPNCGEGIKFYHNVPILGWMMLGGKCANCSAAIAWRYPAVEFLTAAVFVLILWQVGFTVFLPVALIFASVMIALVFIDADHMILPNVITYPLFIFALVMRVLLPLVSSEAAFSDTRIAPVSYLHNAGYPEWLVSLTAGLFGALIGGGSLWLVGAIWKALRGVDAMGLGDVKLLLGVGALLGWRLTILTIFLGAFVGAIAGIALVSRQKERDLQTQIPFGIFLGIGAVVAMLFGDRMIEWYLGKFM